MRCEKHKNYKGVKPPTKNKNCFYCDQIYKKVSKESCKYYSITTPNFYCSIIHILAECMTIMLFGQQSPYFWRKNSNASLDAKRFFKRAFSELKMQQKKNPQQMESIKLLFGIIVYNEKRKIEANKIRKQFEYNQEITIKEKANKTITDMDVVKTFLNNNVTKPTEINKWQRLLELEKHNGEKEKRKKSNS